TALIVGYGAHLLLGLDLLLALLLGVIIAPTDPVSVLATFRNANVDRDLSTIVESESLFNDGIAVVLYVILLETLEGVELSLLQGVGDIALVVGGGAVLGLGLGMLATRFLKRLDDHLIEVMITLVLVYGAYLLAEHLHLSGVIAVSISGLVVGNQGLVRTSTYSRQSLTLFWEIVAFLVNSVAFLLIGFELHITRLVDDLLPIIMIFAILLFARAIVVYSLGARSRWRLGKRTDEPDQSDLPWRWLHVIFLGGLRGAVPVALALGLPVSLTGRETLVTIVFGVVLFSLVGQGLSMPTLIQRLGLARDEQIEGQSEQLPMEEVT
ncbi:MAG TPA: sodium:proton antiporter, partial [Anaerolineales bacterium]